ncbi:hypothetical protein [Sorangium sp. So ce1182]|uniref:hypothetical protein n=1 Tax=Sorangium sp. So ce1182 TaxID=3133334 RepID=UPI003F5D8A3A
MTAGERPTTAEPDERSLSAEEADRIAASIRPSWEGFDELSNPRGEARGSAHGAETGVPAAKQAEIQGVPIVGVSDARREPAVASFAAAPAATAAAPAATGAAPGAPAAGVLQAPPAGASGVSDTVIDGVPTIAVGDEPKGVPAAEAAPRDTGAAAGGEQPSQASALPPTDTQAAGGAAGASAPEGGPGKRGEYPAPAGKTRVGMGEPDAMPSARAAELDAPASARAAEPDAPASARAAEPQARPAPAASPLADDEPRSARATRTRSRAAHPAPGKADAAVATAARTDDHDPIEIPVSSPNKTALRLGIAIVGAAFLFFVGRALLAPGRDDAGPEPGPTSASPAAEAPPTVPAATPVATSPATASPSPAASVTEGGATTAPPPSASAPASSSAPAATPPPAAAASSPAKATPAAPPPEPKAAPSAKKPAPPAPTQPGTSSTGGNKGGGIIRDAPF